MYNICPVDPARIIRRSGKLNCIFMKGLEVKERELNIRGMSCQHCVMAVRKELEMVENLSVVNVEIGRAVIRYDDQKIDDRMLAEVIDEAGYELVG